jgi:hypothetical protein
VSTGSFIGGLLGREELVQPGHQPRGRSRRSANQSGYQSVCQSWQTMSHERASITRTPQNEESGHGACTGLCH